MTDKESAQLNFNPRTPCGVRLSFGAFPLICFTFQSTHPLRGATRTGRGVRPKRSISIHAPLAGCDGQLVGGRGVRDISIHAPLAGCDACREVSLRRLRISIHAPLAGCDAPTFNLAFSGLNFNPRTPCGVRPRTNVPDVGRQPFQSTHPLRGATEAINYSAATGAISIHAPLAGCDYRRRGGWLTAQDFNPRTPCGVRLRSSQWAVPQRHFNPRTPCGVRRAGRRGTRKISAFQSTHPLRGATAKLSGRSTTNSISIHAPLAGCDAPKRFDLC